MPARLKLPNVSWVPMKPFLLVVYVGAAAACTSRPRVGPPPPEFDELNLASALAHQDCRTGVLEPRGATVEILRARAEEYRLAGERDSALALYGHVMQLEKPEIADSLCELLLNSPVLQPSRGIDAEAAFTASVTRSVSTIPNAAGLVGDVRSAQRAMATLEQLLAHRRANIIVKHSPPGLKVEFRRWLYRNDSTVLWETVFSDTTLTRQAAAYQFRYRDSRSPRVVLVNLPCWNNCTVPPEQ